MNLAVRQMFTSRIFRFYDKVAHKSLPKQISIISKNPIIQCRNYSDEPAERLETDKLPQLMDFPPIVWPSFMKFIKNFMFAHTIIRPYFDNEFSLGEFNQASKHAVQVVSGALQNGDFKALDGLVDGEAIAILKNAVSKLSMSQRQMLAVDKEDIFYAFPYQVGIMFDDENKRWVEITMCYHVLKGLKQMQESGDLPPVTLRTQPELENKVFILNYRFIREYTKGVEDSWWINIVNHFQPQSVMKKI